SRYSDVQDILNHCKGKDGIVQDIKTTEKKSSPPVPLNLSVLQSQSYNHLGYTPSQTLRIAERLYLSGLISYPRTSSQIIPEDVDLGNIVNGIKNNSKYEKYIEKILAKGPLTPTKGKKSDPAHPPILPTGEQPSRKLSSTEERLLDLITRWFLAIFGDPAVIQSVRVLVGVNSHSFTLNGRKIITPGWMEIYTYAQTKEVILPDFKIGQKLPLEFEVKEKFTSGPSRYNVNSLRKWMEANEIGTKATRADIIDKLSKRGYIGGRQIYLNDLGLALVEVLERYCSEINSVEMTRNLERDMEAIEAGKLNKEEILVRVRSTLGLVLEKFKKYEKNIGVELAESIKSTWERQRIIGDCNKCDGKLVVIRSLGTKKRFIGCTNYLVCAKCDQPKEACICPCEVCGEPKGSCDCKEGPLDDPTKKHYYPKCSNSFPVAQHGTITPLEDKFCPYCEQEFGIKYPMFQLRLPKSKRPFYACVNWTQHPKSKKAKKGEKSEEQKEEETKEKEEMTKKPKKAKKTKKTKKAKKSKKARKSKTTKSKKDKKSSKKSK
ncbi:MAG: DNA topoisomerase, partial [Candidatus Helarchaeales archaeon]